MRLCQPACCHAGASSGHIELHQAETRPRASSPRNLLRRKFQGHRNRRLLSQNPLENRSFSRSIAARRTVNQSCLEPIPARATRAQRWDNERGGLGTRRPRGPGAIAAWRPKPSKPSIFLETANRGRWTKTSRWRSETSWESFNATTENTPCSRRRGRSPGGLSHAD